MRRALLITHQTAPLPAFAEGLSAAGWTHDVVDSLAAAASAAPATALFVDRACVSDADSLAPVRAAHPDSQVVLLGAASPAEALAAVLQFGAFDHVTLPCPADRLALLLRGLEARVTLQTEVARLAHDQDLLSRATVDGSWDLTLATNTIRLSPRWKEMLGYAENELTNNLAEWLDRVHPEERDQVREEIVVHREGLTEFFTSEHRLRHKNGEYRRMLARGLAERDANGKALRILGSHTDITAQRLAEDRLLHEAFHDPLTGLPNGAQLRERLDRAMVHAQRRPTYTYALIFI
jgi:PAS domain S-box-containing protein